MSLLGTGGLWHFSEEDLFMPPHRLLTYLAPGWRSSAPGARRAPASGGVLEASGRRGPWAAWLLAAPMLSMAGAAFGADVLVNQDGLMDLNDGNGLVQVTQGPAGADFIYRAMIKMNSGNATGVKLFQKLPAGAKFVSVTPPAGVSCNGAPAVGAELDGISEISCDIGSLNSGENFKFVDFRVVLPTTGSNWHAVARSTAIEPDENPGNNTDIDRNFTTYEAADLGIVVGSAAAGTGVENGDAYTYTIAVTNYGPSPIAAAGAAVVTFTVPAGAPLTGTPTGSGWSCAPAGAQAAGAVITCTHAGQVAAGGTALPGITVPVQAQMSGPIGFAASVHGKASATVEMPDGQLDNNSAGVTVQSEGSDYTDVSLSKSVSPTQIDSLAPSTPVVYTLQVRRESGALQPEQVVVTDTLPAGVTYTGLVAGMDARWSCVNSGQNLTCTWDNNQPYTDGNNTNFPEIKFNATVAGGSQLTGTVIDNESAVAVKPGTEPDTTNNRGKARVTFSNVAALSLSKVQAGNPPRPIKKGVLFQYELTVTNDGPMNILPGQQITLVDTPTTPLKLISRNAGSSAGWSCGAFSQNAGDPVTCTYTVPASPPGPADGFTAGTSIKLVLDARVDDVAANTEFVTFSNGATATGPGQRDVTSVSDSATVTVSDSSADLDVTKVVTSGATDLKSGDEVTYLITLTNKGPQTAQSITLTDPLNNLVIPGDGAPGNYPGGGFISAVIQSQPAGAGAVCPAPSGSATSRNRLLTCTVNQLAINERVTVEVKIRPRMTTASPATSYANYVNTASAYSSVINDPDLTNNSRPATVRIKPLVDLTVAKEVSPADAVAAGEPAIYTVTVQNLGPSSAQGVSMVDVLPPNAIMLGEPEIGDANDNGGTCIHSAGAPMDGKTGGTMTCTWTKPLPAHSQYTVQYHMRSTGGDPGEGDTLYNHVEVSTATEEIRYDNNEADISIALKPPQLDVQVQMSHTADGLVLGEDTVYTITVSNNSSSTSYATNVNMTDLFPAAGSTATFSWQGNMQLVGRPTTKPGYLTAVGGTLDVAALCPTQPAMDATTGPLTCVLPLLAPGDSVDIKFTMKALSLPDGASVGTIFHQATVSLAETEDMPGIDVLANNTTADRTSTSRTANPIDLGVTKTGSGDTFKPGDEVTYTITVTNYGREDRSPAATLVDILPKHLLFKSATGGGGCAGVADTSEEVTCVVPELDKGESVEFTLVAQIAKPYGGSYPLVNKAVVQVDGDTNPENDESTFETKIPEPPIAPVPTLSQWALILLSMLMAGFALTQRARRR